MELLFWFILHICLIYILLKIAFNRIGLTFSDIMKDSDLIDFWKGKL